MSPRRRTRGPKPSAAPRGTWRDAALSSGPVRPPQSGFSSSQRRPSDPALLLHVRPGEEPAHAARLGRRVAVCPSPVPLPDAPPRALRGAGPLTRLPATALGAPPFLLLLLLQPSSCPAASDLLSVFYSLPFFDFSTGNTFRVPRASQTQLEAPSCTLSQPPRSAASRVDIAQRSRDSVLNQSADSARASPSVPVLAWDPVQDGTQHAVSLSLPQSETLPRPLCVTTLALPRVTGRLFCRVLLRLGLADASSRSHSG